MSTIDWSSLEKTPNGAPEVSPSWTHRHRENIRVIDIREHSEIHGELGRIAYSQHIPMGALLKELQDSPREEKIILVCRSGRRTERMALQMIQASFTHVASMNGGMLRWNRENLPVSHF